MKLIAAFMGLAVVTLAGTLPALAQQSSDDQVEAKIGQQEYQQLQQKGEIIGNSPYYAILKPIAAQIKRVADRQYFHPFQFILVHETQPNAFAVPGGNVYVTDSLMQFVKYREELAGVLCHETSHDIHHDVMNLNAKAQTQGAVIGLLGSLLGVDKSSIGRLGEQILYTTQTARFSRAVETAADLKG